MESQLQMEYKCVWRDSGSSGSGQAGAHSLVPRWEGAEGSRGARAPPRPRGALPSTATYPSWPLQGQRGSSRRRARQAAAGEGKDMRAGPPLERVHAGSRCRRHCERSAALLSTARRFLAAAALRRFTAPTLPACPPTRRPGLLTTLRCPPGRPAASPGSFAPRPQSSAPSRRSRARPVQGEKGEWSDPRRLGREQGCSSRAWEQTQSVRRNTAATPATHPATNPPPLHAPSRAWRCRRRLHPRHGCARSR